MGPIFISYKSQQRDFAFLARDHLRRWGYITWLDADDLQDEANWATEIATALETASVVVAIATPEALASRYVTNEWDTAITRGIPCLLLEFKTTPVYKKYAFVRKIDFTANRESAFAGFEQELRNALAQAPSGVQDARQKQLFALYERLTADIATRTITTLKTYGPEAQRNAEPIHLSIRVKDQCFDDVFEALHDLEGRVLLLGSAGAGKTVTLLHYARDLIIERMLNPAAPFPLIKSIAGWNPEQEVADWLEDDLLPGEKMIFLLDSLDEAIGSKQRFLEQLDAIPQVHELIISCRHEYYETLVTDFRFDAKLLIEPLSSRQIGDYLRDEPRLRDFVQSNEQTQSWLSNPLLLSFMAFAFEDITDEQLQEISSLESPNKLRDVIFNEFIDRSYEREAQRMAARGKRMQYELGLLRRILGYHALQEIQRPHTKTTPYQIVGRNVEPIEKIHTYQTNRQRNYSNILKIAKQLQILNGESSFVHTTLRDTCAFPVALELLNTSSDSIILWTAIFALRQIQDPRAVQTIQQNYERISQLRPLSRKMVTGLKLIFDDGIDPQAVGVGMSTTPDTMIDFGQDLDMLLAQLNER